MRNGRESPISVVDVPYAASEIIATKLFPEISNTHYLDQKELSACLVKRSPDGDFMIWANPSTSHASLVDTTQFSSKKGIGYAAYALSTNGELYIHEHVSAACNSGGKPYFYHSSFFGAKPGICFGMIAVENGKITYIDNHSGHYQPQKAHLDDAVERLQWAFSDDADIQLHTAEQTGHFKTISEEDFDLGGLFI